METDAPRARITRVWAENFRSIGRMDLELGDVTVLVGRNGAGKSNSLAVLRFMRDCLKWGFDRALTDWEGLQNIRRDGSEGLAVGMEVTGEGWVYQYDLRFDGDEAEDRSETIQTRLRGEDDWVEFGSFAPRIKSGSDQSLVSHASDFSFVADSFREPAPSERHLDAYAFSEQALDRVSFYDFEPQGLKRPQKSRVNAHLAEDGSNLYGVLRFILGGEDKERVNQVVEAVVGDALEVDVSVLGSHLLGEVLYRSAGDGEPVRRDVGVESDGTVHLLAILGALYQGSRDHGVPSLVAIEEPGRNLHPGALAVLADVIREVSTRLQVVITTHSPDLVGKFEPDEILVVERVEGNTVVGPLDPVQREIIGDRLFSAADLMRVQRLLRDEAS